MPKFARKSAAVSAVSWSTPNMSAILVIGQPSWSRRRDIAFTMFGDTLKPFFFFLFWSRIWLQFLPFIVFRKFEIPSRRFPKDAKQVAAFAAVATVLNALRPHVIKLLLSPSLDCWLSFFNLRVSPSIHSTVARASIRDAGFST